MRRIGFAVIIDLSLFVAPLAASVTDGEGVAPVTNGDESTTSA